MFYFYARFSKNLAPVALGAPTEVEKDVTTAQGIIAAINGAQDDEHTIIKATLGTGTTKLEQEINISAKKNVTIKIIGSNSFLAFEKPLTNNGTLTLTSPANCGFINNSKFTNHGTFDLSADSKLVLNNSTFINETKNDESITESQAATTTIDGTLTATNESTINNQSDEKKDALLTIKADGKIELNNSKLNNKGKHSGKNTSAYINNEGTLDIANNSKYYDIGDGTNNSKIDNNKTLNISADSEFHIDKGDFTNYAPLALDGTINIYNSGKSNNKSDLTINAGAKIELYGGGFTNEATTTVDGALGAFASGSITNNFDSTLTINPNAKFELNKGTLNNYGILELDGAITIKEDSKFNNSIAFTIKAGEKIELNNSTLTNSNALTIDGTLIATNDSTINNNNNGKLTINTSGKIELNNSKLTSKPSMSMQTTNVTVMGTLSATNKSAISNIKQTGIFTISAGSIVNLDESSFTIDNIKESNLKLDAPINATNNSSFNNKSSFTINDSNKDKIVLNNSALNNLKTLIIDCDYTVNNNNTINNQNNATLTINPNAKLNLDGASLTNEGTLKLDGPVSLDNSSFVIKGNPSKITKTNGAFNYTNNSNIINNTDQDYSANHIVFENINPSNCKALDLSLNHSFFEQASAKGLTYFLPYLVCIKDENGQAMDSANFEIVKTADQENGYEALAKKDNLKDGDFYYHSLLPGTYTITAPGYQSAILDAQTYTPEAGADGKTNIPKIAVKLKKEVPTNPVDPDPTPGGSTAKEPDVPSATEQIDPAVLHQYIVVKDAANKIIQKAKLSDSNKVAINIEQDLKAYNISFNIAEINKNFKDASFSINLPNLNYEFSTAIQENIINLNKFLETEKINPQDVYLNLTINKLQATDLAKAQKDYSALYPQGKINSDFYAIDLSLKDKNNKDLNFKDFAFKEPQKLDINKDQAGEIMQYLQHDNKFAFTNGGKLKHCSIYVKASNNASFKDVQNHWAEKDIAKAANKALVIGTGNNLYQPENQVTRAQFVQMLVNALQLNQAVTPSYSDIKTNSWYYEAIAKAQNAQLLTSFDEKEFKPNQAINREEMADLLSQALKNANLDLIKYTDLDLGTKYKDAQNINEKYQAAVKIISQAQIMEGMTDGTFAPQENTTRAQAATTLIRFINLIN